ncbi:unnamed protein product [Brugia pahangi]|uniref:J domain-containing protein n=1 Tax=Brugia pahangi TaxID=6280 RepID=A0A0N4TSA2_BRUPA|nr:unnamed protein product [Brugia pahangi]
MQCFELTKENSEPASSRHSVEELKMELSLRSFFRDFNAPKFVLYSCLLCFFILLPLRFDGTIELNYALVFLPLWICEFIVFLGAIVAAISFVISPPSLTESSLRSDFYGMILCTGEHGLLILFEVLCCHKLQANATVDELPWLLVFVPIFALSLLSVVVAIWAIRNDKSFEVVVCSVEFKIGTLLFHQHCAVCFCCFQIGWYIGLALDNRFHSVVGGPILKRRRIQMKSLNILQVLYAFVLAVVLARSVHMLASQRRQHVYSALCHTLLVIPVLVFLLLLTGKLDAISWSDDEPVSQIAFIIVCAPLDLALFCLILMSFGARGGNPWWFAMRAPFCSFLLEACPCLKQYANVSYKFRSSSERQHITEDFEKQSLQSDRSIKFPLRIIMRNCYDVLGCSSEASYSELKEAYFCKLRTSHPDKGGSSLALFLVTKAWSVLKNENTRRDYNIWLREQLLREDQGIIGQQIVIDNTVERIEEFCRYILVAVVNIFLKRQLLIVLLILHILNVQIVRYVWRHDIIPSSTVGCAVSVIAHQYRAGSTDEQTELIELWDIGGSTVHQKASVNFFEGSFNKKSESNLSQWVALLRGESSLPSVISSFTSSSSSRFLLSDIESTAMPTLIVGCKSDLAPERAKQTAYDRIFLNCQRPISPGSTNRIILSKFFDSVVERKKVPGAGDKRRRTIIT